jgi:GR25 family glycosyltransferase involved in LPS biosynthesis
MIHSINDIKHVFYINLEHRKDRKEHVEKQLGSVNLPIERFNAIRLSNGAAGCSMSHLKCLETAKKNKWTHILICEDDIEFTNPALFTQQLNSFLEKHQDDWDVVLLAGNTMPPYRIPENDDTCIQVSHSQTTTGYLVKSHYFDVLISNVKEGLEKLMLEPEKHKEYAIDKYWLSLQKQDRWFLIVPLTVVQKIDYSDIEKKMTNYKKVMTILDKK